MAQNGHSRQPNYGVTPAHLDPSQLQDESANAELQRGVSHAGDTQADVSLT